MHTLSQEQIAEFQVAMNDFLGMNVLTCFDELVNVVTSFYLMQPLASSNEVWKWLVVADIKHDVDIFFVLKVAIEADNILIV